MREAACLPNSARALFAVWEEWPQPNATVVMCALLSTQWTQKYDTSLNILQIVQPRLAVNARVTTILTIFRFFLPACCGLTTPANALGQIAFKNLVFLLFLLIF